MFYKCSSPDILLPVQKWTLESNDTWHLYYSDGDDNAYHRAYTYGRTGKIFLPGTSDVILTVSAPTITYTSYIYGGAYGIEIAGFNGNTRTVIDSANASYAGKTYKISQKDYDFIEVNTSMTGCGYRWPPGTSYDNWEVARAYNNIELYYTEQFVY